MADVPDLTALARAALEDEKRERDDFARLDELIVRLVASGPKAAHVSASECHEISDDTSEALAELRSARTREPLLAQGYLDAMAENEFLRTAVDAADENTNDAESGFIAALQMGGEAAALRTEVKAYRITVAAAISERDAALAESAHLRCLMVSARAALGEYGFFGLAWMMDAAVHGAPWRNQLAEQRTSERDAALAEVARLTERQQSHLETIRKITQTTPLDSEVEAALEQRGALLAEIGTLRSALASKDPR